MHCEMEGYRLGAWLDNVRNGVIAGGVSFAAFCVLCEVVTLGALDFLCGWLGGVVAAIIAFFAWLLSHPFNDPDDHVAESVDVDVEEEGFTVPPTEATRGDVVALFGDWIMDTEHLAYFEIHPVKSWYLLCRNPELDKELTDATPAGDCHFDVTQLTRAEADEICRIIREAETRDPDEQVKVPLSHGLSMGAGIK